MAANIMEGGHNLPSEKYFVHESEEVEHGRRSHSIDRRESTKHGDRALALIGDERVFLTEEDVRELFSFCLYTFTWGFSC